MGNNKVACRLKYTKIKFCGVAPFLIPMMRCIINYDNIKVEVFIYVYFWYKKNLLMNPMIVIVGVRVTNHSLRIHLMSVVVGPPL